MTELRLNERIPRSPAEAFAALTDMRAFSSWLPRGWTALTPITQTQVGKGARTTFTLDALGLDLPAEIEITEAVEARVRWSVAAPPIDAIFLFHLAPEGDGTAVTLEANWHQRRLPPWRLRTLARVRRNMDDDLGTHARALLEAFTRHVGALPRQAAPPPGDPRLGKRTSDGFEDVGPADLGPGQARAVKVFGKTVAVFNVDGGFYAIDDDCPHRQGPLSQGELADGIVTCPLHRWRFDVRTGDSVTQPSSRVRTWRVKAQDGRLLVGEAR